MADEWRARRLHAKARVAARRLYAGRGFSLAYEVTRAIGAQLRVISAGMGLIHPDTAIPSYSLTLSPETRDCILCRASRNDPFTAEQWWQAVRSRAAGARPFERWLAAYPKALMVLALTRPYLGMITGELKALGESDLHRVRIVGLTHSEILPDALRPCVMPYDFRLNDVGRRVRGTAFDFPSRALLHFTELVRLDRHIVDAASHARRVRQSLAHWKAPELNPRERIDDATLRRKIRWLKAKDFSRTAGLRCLRRDWGLACEQRRFSVAWDCV